MRFYQEFREVPRSRFGKDMDNQNFRSGRDDLYELARGAACGDDGALEKSLFSKSVAAIENKQGSRARIDLLRETLSRLVKANQRSIDDLSYPDSVLALIHAEFERIKDCTDNAEDDYFDLAKKTTRHDFRIACFGRVPAGMEYIESSGLPRSLCVRGGVGQCLRFLGVLRRTGGLKPFYETHIAVNSDNPLRFFRKYNQEARARTYRNVAACLERNPQYRGLMTASWWFDPQLQKISSALASLGEVMLQNGAILLREGRTSWARNTALNNSPARQKLYDEGKYFPTNYFVVWPRDSLIAWARGH